MNEKTISTQDNRLVNILFAIILVIGILFCVFIPYGAGFDEEAHLVRIFDISGLHMIPNRGIEKGGYTLSEIFSLSYQRRDFQTPAFDQFLPSIFLVKADWQNMSEGITRSHYFPANYFLHGLVAGIGWRVFDFPIIPVVILMKIVEFLFYLAACYLTFRMLPVGKWVFLVTAFTPMALFLCGTLNADIFTLACSFLFIGATLEYFSKRDQVAASYVPWKLILVILLVGCTKPGTFLILLLLLILIRRPVRSKKTSILLLVAMIISMAISIRWMMFSADDSNFKLWTPNSTVSSQFQIILANIPDFIRFYISGILHSLGNYYTGIVGVYGYWVGQVPTLVYVFFPLAIIFALLAEKKNNLLTKKNMILIILVGLICFAEIAAFHFIAFYVPGTTNIDIVGRYFLPFFPLLFIPFAGKIEIGKKYEKLPILLCIVSIIACISFYGYGIYRTYYTDCVYAVSKESPCRLPVYKNFEVNNPFIAHVTNENEVKQSFVPKCSELQSVRVLIETVAASPEDEITMVISDDNHQYLETKVFKVFGLKHRDYLEIATDIQAIPNETVLWIYLRMEPSNSAKAGLGILGRIPGTKYSDGKLLFNQEFQDGDIYFQYTCK